MASATLLKSSFLPKKSEWGATRQAAAPKPVTVSMVVRAGAYDDELVKTAKTIASPGRGILAMDESNATCGKRLASIGLENTEANRQAYRTLLVTAPGLGQYISGAILFEETLYQSTVDGKKIVDILTEQKIVPGIKVDKGLVPLAGSNNESWCQGGHVRQELRLLIRSNPIKTVNLLLLLLRTTATAILLVPRGHCSQCVVTVTG
uniref:fructose-bisphosphate aldolase n=1 Tax=Oryza sativa subsp. japonica TaxID=39947 RepID=H2KVZ8_ORYSJ|nr:Fructose-bisphosphate aldolase, chloroplast precursor, putative, expressed [Oryza sativa Japonica Group]